MHAAGDGVLYERWLTERDERAFAEIAARHAPTVFDIAVRSTGDRTAAEDAVQEALLNLALEPTRRPIEVGLAAWLARFAICRARNKRSSELSRARRQRVVGAKRAEEVMPDDGLELSDELEHVLARAEPEERTILAMRYLHGWSYAQIAASIEVSEGAARVRVHRALTRVRTRIGVETVAGGEKRLMAAIGALPAAALPPDLLARTVDDVLRIARMEIGAGSGAADATTASLGSTAESTVTGTLGAMLRAGLKGIAPALLVVATGLALESPPAAVTSSPARVARVEVVGSGEATGPVTLRYHRDVTAARASSVTPRPADWDDGVVGRIGRGDVQPELSENRRNADREDSETSPESSSSDTPTNPVAPPEGGDQATEHSNASRPNSRGACAARCDSVSSEDERVGAFLGSVDRRDSDHGEADHRDAVGSLADAAHAAPSDLSADAACRGDGTATGAVPAPIVAHPDAAARGALRPLSEIDSAERALVEEAGELVKDLFTADLEELATSPRALRRELRRIQRMYRKQRRDILVAATNGDSEALQQSTALASRLSKVRGVLSSLLDVVLADGSSIEDVAWPSGADVSAALEDLVSVLGAAANAVGPLPDGYTEAGESDDASADGLAQPMPQGLMPDGFVPANEN